MKSANLILSVLAATWFAYQTLTANDAVQIVCAAVAAIAFGATAVMSLVKA